MFFKMTVQNKETTKPVNVSVGSLYSVGTHDMNKNQNIYIFKSKVKDTKQCH